MATSIASPLNGMFYDLKDDIGCKPYDSSDATMAYNQVQLTSALQAMHAGGNFAFKRTPRGPCLYPIKANGMTYYFRPPIETNTRIGGALIGTGGGGYIMDDVNYLPGGSLGGMRTRFVFVNSGNHNYPCIRLKGEGFECHGFEVYGQKIVNVNNMATWVGTKAIAGFQCEGGSAPDRGRPIIHNCNIYTCEYGIHTLNGYFDLGANADYDFTNVDLNWNESANDQPKGYLNAAGFHVNENHSDLGNINKVECYNVRSAIRAENQVTICWQFNHLMVEFIGIPQDCTVFDFRRGGYFNVNTLVADHPKITLISVGDWSPNTNGSMVIYNLYWDYFGGNNGVQTGDYITFFKYRGPVWHDQNLNGGNGYPWTVRIQGGLSWGNPAEYDTSKYIICPEEGITLRNILLDVTNLKTDMVNGSAQPYFSQVGHMWKPTNLWNGRVNP